VEGRTWNFDAGAVTPDHVREATPEVLEQLQAAGLVREVASPSVAAPAAPGQEATPALVFDDAGVLRPAAEVKVVNDFTPASARARAHGEALRSQVQGQGPGRRLAESMAGNWKGFVAAYRARQTQAGKNPNHIDPDEMAFLLPEYADNPAARPDLQDDLRKVSGMAADLMYQDAVEDAQSGSRVVINAGGPGVGKSTAALNDKTVSADVSLDGTQSNLKRARERIQKALQHGHEVVFRFVHQEPTIALMGSIDRAAGDLRTVPAKDAAEANAAARDTLFQLQAEFANEPRVKFKVIDHSQPDGPTLTVAEFAARPYESLSVDDAVILAKNYINERHPALPPNAQARILGRVRGDNGQTSQRGTPSGGQEVGTPRASGSGISTPDGQNSPAGQGPGFRNTDVVGRRQDGSTVVFGELVDLAARAVQAGVDFATWAGQMLKQFGEAVLNYLAGAWQAAKKTSQVGAINIGARISARAPLQLRAVVRLHQSAQPFLWLIRAHPGQRALPFQHKRTAVVKLRHVRSWRRCDDAH
jgi:hypothetical protein